MRLLATGTINRPDLIGLFSGVQDSAELCFVEYERQSATSLDADAYRPYGALTTWNAHASANRLLDRIRPDRLVMLAINSREEVALRMAASRRGLEVLHLEHGYRLPLSVRAEIGLDRMYTKRRIAPGVARHAFFARSLASAPRGEQARLAGYGARTLRGVTPAQAGAYGDIRRPDRYVSFAPACFEFHRELDRVPPDVAARTRYVGVPTFDCFLDGCDRVDEDSVVLIDHQLHNGDIAGWTVAFRHYWAQRLFETVCARAGMRLLVKEHPGDTSGAWEPYLGRGVTRLGSIEDLARALRSTRIVLGGVSTLQIPAAGLSHTALLTLEIHPHGGRLSAPFVDAGVAQPIESYAELDTALARAGEINLEQHPHKAAFVTRFMHKLDGLARERLVRALLQ
jgi:hypothetical protein